MLFPLTVTVLFAGVAPPEKVKDRTAGSVLRVAPLAGEVSATVPGTVSPWLLEPEDPPTQPDNRLAASRTTPVDTWASVRGAGQRTSEQTERRFGKRSWDDLVDKRVQTKPAGTDAGELMELAAV